MFFRQRAGSHATLSHFFGCSSVGRSVAVDVVAADEQWFLDEAERRGVPISIVIDTHVHADRHAGGLVLARSAGATHALHESNRGRTAFDFKPLADGVAAAVGGRVESAFWLVASPCCCPARC